MTAITSKRLLQGIVARLGSLLAVGVPSAGHLLGLALELIVVPLLVLVLVLVLWQGRVAAAYVALAQSK